MSVVYSFIVLGTRVIVMTANYWVWPLGHFGMGWHRLHAADTVSCLRHCSVLTAEWGCSLSAGHSCVRPGPRLYKSGHRARGRQSAANTTMASLRTGALLLGTGQWSLDQMNWKWRVNGLGYSCLSLSHFVPVAALLVTLTQGQRLRGGRRQSPRRGRQEAAEGYSSPADAPPQGQGPQTPLCASAHGTNGEGTWSHNGTEHDVQSHRHARQVLWSQQRHSPYSKPIYKGGGRWPPPQKRCRGLRPRHLFCGFLCIGFE